MYRTISHYKFQLAWLSGLVLVSLVLALFKAAPVYAGGVVGDGTAGSCTEAAFNTALSGGGAITFNCGGPATITFTTFKEISADTIIDGGGVITLSGSNVFLFQVFFDTSLTLQNITLANGSASAAGAIESIGTTHIINSHLLNNQSPTGSGGAIHNYGTLNLTNTILSNNRAADGGGGIYNDGGVMYLTGSQLIGNVVTGTTGTGGGITNQAGSMTLNGVTLSGNVAGGNGGGIYSNAPAVLTNVTLSGNRATGPGSGGGGMCIIRPKPIGESG
jgi:predicted outer membrane repeat protein